MQYKINKKTNRGFSFMEVMVVIAIMVVISAIILFSFRSLNNSQALDKDVLLVLAVLNDARSLTLSSKGGVQYGVHFDEFKITMFKGATYTAGDANNVQNDLNSAVHVSATSLAGGGSDILFQRLTGVTSQYGTITLSQVSDSSINKTITVYKTGVIESN